VTIQRVERIDDERLADYVGLTDVALRSRREPELGLYLAESDKVIRRALVERVEAAGVPVFAGAPHVLESITGFNVHRGAIASMHRPPLPDPKDLLAAARRVVVLEDVVDHTNVGAAFRSVAGLGADAVLVTPRCADPLYRRAVRVSMGTVFQVPWTRIDPWPQSVAFLQELGFTVGAMALRDDAVSLDALAADPPERLALVLGTEGDGLAPATVAAADLAVRIPMRGGVDSLNVAAATAVAVWALRVRA
jgi:tRNA G18 (ribose-2'-O)-methylase SpoU